MKTHNSITRFLLVRVRKCTILFLILLVSCSGSTDNSTLVRPLPATMSYAFECLNENSEVNQMSDLFGKVDEFFSDVATSDIEVTDKEENEFGEKYLREARKQKGFFIDQNNKVNSKLNLILNNLLRVRSNPSSLQYQVYLIRDDASVNAYTIGGKIFVTTGIINKCINDDQLYSIIGHEIGHNEKGHIKSTIKQVKASNRDWGEWGGAFLGIKGTITARFNQKKELEADYYGIDLAWKSGKDVCAIKSFWDDMAKNEKRDVMKDFFSTHPYSDARSKCIVNHIEKNFKKTCN